MRTIPDRIEIGRHGKQVPGGLVEKAVFDLGKTYSIEDIKSRARIVLHFARSADYPLKHSEALEAIAKALGFDSFPALREQLNGGSHGR